MPRRKPAKKTKKVSDGAQYHHPWAFTRTEWERMQEKKDMHVVRPATHTYGSDVA